MDFKEVLRQNKEMVWTKINTYLNDFANIPPYCQITPKYQSLADFHYQLISEYPRRQGKYVRPTLVSLTASAMGFPYEKTVVTAAAMQISEDWILNHDDIEDDSLFRRGLPTLHRLFSKELAINAGDGLHLLMWKVLRDNEKHLGVKKTFEIFDEFYNMLNRTFLGQTIEIKWFQENNLTLTDEDIFLILESKTGYYTIAGPMRLGAILADATDEQLKNIYKFGVLLGRAFQIKDDLLDLTSTFDGQKNQQGNDIYEGKRTTMLAHLIRSVNTQDKQKLITILGKDRYQKTQPEVDWVINRMHHYGSIQYGTDLAKKFANDSRSIFESDLSFLTVQPYRDQLLSAIEFIVNRDH